MVFSGSFFVPQMYTVETRVLGDCEDGRPDLESWLAGRELWALLSTHDRQS